MGFVADSQRMEALMVSSRVAVAFCLLVTSSPAIGQEADPTTGQMPDPSTYQGSQELQRQDDEQGQRQREQLQQQAEQQQRDWDQAVHDTQAMNARPGQGQIDRPPASRTVETRRSTPTAAVPAAPANPLVAAFQRGDYATVLRILRPKAMAGNPSAEHNLGFMYETGYGVPRNPAIAASWYRKSADQGYPIGQLALGRLYYQGMGLQRNLVEAYKWMYLAGRGTSRAFPYLRLIGNMLTYEQMATAIREGQLWTPVIHR